MDIFDIKHCLESMSIIVDSREQPTKRARDRYKAFGCPYDRGKLNYGDYTYNFTLPDGMRAYDIQRPIDPCVSIERKMNIGELCQCFGKGRDRFEREFERAAMQGGKIYLLVENASWEKIYNGSYNSRFHPNALVASTLGWSTRYGFQIIFCRPETTGKMIRDILYRELKARLERGDYDGVGV